MPIVRSRIRNRFTILPNALLRNKALSPNALALLSVMLSFPDDWHFRMSWLREHHIDLGKIALKHAFKELEEKGYAERVEKKGDDGKFSGYDYIIYDEPIRDSPEGDGPAPGKPVRENRGASGRAARERPPTNTEDHEDVEEELLKPLSPEATLSPSSSSSKEKISKAQVEKIVEIWNENCDALPSVKAIGSKREREIRRIIKEHGFDAACDLIRRATLAVAHDDFWRSRRKYGFDNLLAGDKYLQKAETWRDGGGVGVDVREGSRVLFKVTVGMTETEVPGEVVAVEDKQYVVRPEGAGDAPLPLSGDLSDTMRIPHSHVIRRL